MAASLKNVRFDGNGNADHDVIYTVYASNGIDDFGEFYTREEAVAEAAKHPGSVVVDEYADYGDDD